MEATKTTAELHAEAREITTAARRKYNETWRKNPTAAGYKLVDKALADLQAAEKEEVRLADLLARGVR